jgi:sn-glycerol 3-phosphate transport system substrate-binding protein
MTAAVAAFRAGEQPHIVQVFEVGTATMMAAEGAIYPVHQLMADAGIEWDPASFLSAVVGYYTTSDGLMLSMPFNSSTPVLYYNKAAFEAAGLDPEQPPETWDQLVEFAEKTQEAGYPCGFTTQWQSWIQVENMSAWHNKPLGTQANGFEGLDTELVINQNDITPRHIANMGEWQKTKIFDYGGRRGDPDPKFFTGECAMFFASSAAYATVKANVQGFEFGIGMLPYYDDVEGAPQNSIIGGATLWVLQGREEADYEGVAEFFEYLSSPEVQADWHQFTGYLPITEAAYELTKEQGFYEKNPGTETAIQQITLNPPTENSKGLRFGSFVQIRDIVNEELEAVWQGSKSAQQALDDAVARGNELIRRFEDANS